MTNISIYKLIFLNIEYFVWQYKLMASLKAKKITNTKNSQLATFVASLGVKNNIELYLCGEYVYINIDILLPVLLVDTIWFRKNAEIPTHYILIKKNIYINKYGMTKLLGQSKQPAAFMLQDYLYEIFYKVETEGSVSRDDLDSRKKLLMLSDELSTYKAIIEKNQTAVEIAQEESKNAINDYATLELENADLVEQLEQAESDNEALKKEVESYKTIANSLSKYVKCKVKNPPDEAYSDLLDDENSDTDPAEAVVALKKLNKPVKVRKPIIKPTLNTYHIMRSIQPLDDDVYQWSISDVPPSDEIIKDSEAFMSGEMIYIRYLYIYYRKVSFSEDKKKYGTSIFRNDEQCYD